VLFAAILKDFQSMEEDCPIGSNFVLQMIIQKATYVGIENPIATLRSWGNQVKEHFELRNHQSRHPVTTESAIGELAEGMSAEEIFLLWPYS